MEDPGEERPPPGIWAAIVVPLVGTGVLVAAGDARIGLPVLVVAVAGWFLIRRRSFVAWTVLVVQAVIALIVVASRPEDLEGVRIAGAALAALSLAALCLPASRRWASV